MSKNPDSVGGSIVHLDPSQTLKFFFQPDKSVKAFLTISNPYDSESVIFKLKTTQPKLYVVKPNIGILGPSQQITIEITFQCMKPDQPIEQNLEEA